MTPSRIVSTLAFAVITTIAGIAAAGPEEGAPPQREESDPEHLGVGVLGGLGFPRPLEIEGLVRIERTVALGLEYSALPKMTISGVDATFWAVAGDVRLFPFRGAFFVGLRGGVQHAGASGTFSVAQLGSVFEQVDVDTTFINPRLGFLWGRAPGVLVGIEIGVQLPIASSTSSTLPAIVAQNESVTQVTNTVGKNALPTFDLLRLGVIF